MTNPTPRPPARSGSHRRRPTTLRVRGPEDLLAAVPALLGFHPERSVVMVTVGPAGSPVHARVDLPDAADRGDQVRDVVDELATVAARSRVGEVALVLYTDDVPLAVAVASALASALRRAGVAPVAVVRADGREWFHHDRDGSAPADATGTRYRLETHPITVSAVVEGRVVHPSRAALRASLRWTDPAAVASVGRAAERHSNRMLAAGRSPESRPRRVSGHVAEEARWVRDRVRRFLADRRALDADDAARLLVAMLAIGVRDVAWAQIDHSVSQASVDLWRDLVRRSPPGLGAAPAALLAFSAWLSGEGALAWCAVERCQEEQPDYGLAGLVAQALAAAVPPSTWRPLGPDALPLLVDEDGR